MKILDSIAAAASGIAAVRRDIHAHPELCFKEERTADVIAAQLSAWEAARLAVMLPRPRYFEQRPRSAYLNHRTATIVARMRRAELP